jgi:hypothetical protein
MKNRSLMKGIFFAAFFAAFAALPGNTFAQNDDSKDAFVGAIEKIDAEGKVLYVKSKDGVIKAFKWTKKSSVHGIKEAVIWTDHTAHVGAHVVIRSIKIAGEETVAGIHWFGAGAVKVVKGTVKFVAKGTNKVAHAVAGEATEIYEIAEHAVVHTGKDIWHGAKKVEKSVEKEVKADLHIIEKDGKKFVKFIRHSFEDKM